MSRKAPIYKEKNFMANKDLFTQLKEAVDNLEHTMQASEPIYRTSIVGYGVSKAKRAIAADAVISIARQIKGLKGW